MDAKWLLRCQLFKGCYHHQFKTFAFKEKVVMLTNKLFTLILVNLFSAVLTSPARHGWPWNDPFYTDTKQNTIIKCYTSFESIWRQDSKTLSFLWWQDKWGSLPWQQPQCLFYYLTLNSFKVTSETSYHLLEVTSTLIIVISPRDLTFKVSKFWPFINLNEKGRARPNNPCNRCGFNEFRVRGS